MISLMLQKSCRHVLTLSSSDVLFPRLEKPHGMKQLPLSTSKLLAQPGLPMISAETLNKVIVGNNYLRTKQLAQ